jgi:hypothetical protein
MLDRVLDAFHEQELSIESVQVGDSVISHGGTLLQRTSHAFILNEHTWFNSSRSNIGKSPRRKTAPAKQRWYHSDGYLTIMSKQQYMDDMRTKRCKSAVVTWRAL